MQPDIEKARLIVSTSRKVWVSAAGQLRENIAEAVAQGIALGRKEGLEIAAQAITKELGKLPSKSE